MKPKNTELQICSKLCILTSLFIVITVAEPLVSIPSRSIYNFKKIPENIFKEQGRERYSTHIQLDREIYRPGETLFWRSWIVNAFDNSPLPSSRSGSYTIEIVGPKGDVVSSEETYTCGTVDGDWVHLKYEDSGLYLSCEQSTIQLQEFKDDSTQLFRVNDNSFIECKAYPSMVVERNNNNDFMELMKENNRYIWPTTENGHRLTGDNLPFKPVTNTVGSRIRTTTRSSPVWVPYSESNWVILGRTWQIPSDLPGGNYILRIKFQDRYPVSERSFSVRSYRNPLVNFDTKFTQPGYGPSDTVVAVVKVKAADGSSLVGASLTITAQFNGDQIFSQEQQVQSYSNTISFPLPANFSTESSASITIAVNDPRLTDSSTVSVPLVLPGLLQLNFYPEGGPLVNNINNTVYFEALHSITNEPVSIEGILYENSEKILTPITTIHEGRGKFSLIPKLGAKYSVLVTKPTGTSTIFSLPEAIDNGAIIHSSSNIYGNTVDLELSLSGIAIENKGEFKVYLYKREEEIAMVTPNFIENTAKVQFTLSEKISGVLRVTLFHNNLPIAERLVFRENSKKLQIKIETIDEKKKYTPGSRVTLKLTTTDEHGVPVSAALGVSVTDETVIKMTEERKRAPRLPEMVQLENEVLNLTDSHVYLSDSPFAATAIDLLLGTQGWRRFVYKNPQKFINEYGDKAKKMLVYELVQRYHHMHRQMYKVRGFGFQPEMAMNMADAADLLLLDIEPMIGTSSEEDAAAPPEPSETIVTEDLNAIDKLNKEPLELDVYRVYAHQRKERKDSSSRFDFTQTVYWSTALLTSQTGSTEITFDLNDDITSFRVSVDGLVNDEFTYFGTQDLVINSVKNFYIQSKVPLEVTDGDTIRVPISLVNNAGHSVSVATKVSVLGEGLSLIGNPLLDNILPANEGVRQFVDVEVKFTNNSINPALSVSSIATNNNDTWSSLFFPKDQVQPTEKDQLIRQITVKPAGFPVSIPVGGMLSSEKRFGTSITMPTDVVSNSLKTSIQLYVNPTANLLAAVEALLRQPYGCFEQASSTVYPLVLAQQYFKSHSDVPAELIIKAHYLLENGYKKLISYETSSNGFEWFGAAPGHDALSAYGLLEFTDMSTVFPVDPQLITRTSQWILSQKTADSFTRNSRALDTFGAAPEDVTLAYIVYALTSAGVQYNELEGQIKNLLEISKKSSDPYLLALIARSLLNVGNHDNDATRILEKLVTSQQPDGRVTGAKTSITSSMGTSLDIETTALSVLSWLSIDRFAASAQRSIEWLVSQCQDGKFGSTQSTILTLKAILAYDSVRSRVKEDGTVSIYVDNQLVSSVAFEANQTEPIKFPDLAHLFVANQTHSIELELSNGSPLPFSIQLDMNTLLPRSAPDSPVALTTKLLSDNLAEGQSTNVMVTVTNKRAESVGMVVAIIGLPGGLEARYEKLNELVASKTIDFYESKGREVVLYWRGMAANAEKELSIEVVAAVPGSYTGPASRAYLYYNDDLKEWNDPLRVTVNQNK